ncbi:hypothetical protein [Actinoplanes sp. TFC3]|uniref:hypothetical protein n=1 Tax=Actinoplanes sp. TFC3 TaxID=1710355 RepID=UPI000AFD669C|nr:hypothetical protein [Actinoplanes sp. TFC3]
MRRIAPALALFLLSPLVAEFLLGDFTLSTLPFLVLLAPMYGGGALIIREVARRTGKGWPSIVLLALAFGIFEEGVTTQSLFNPDYFHAHLLEHGFVPALGIALPWTLYVLALHTVWSISVPIALVEEATSRRTEPWLRTPGLIVSGLLFGLGAFGTTMSSYSDGHYLASASQLITVAVILALLVLAAVKLPPRLVREGHAPSPWIVLAVALGAGALFMATKWLPDGLGVPAMLVAFAAAGSSVLVWSRRAGRGGPHRVGGGGGGLGADAGHHFCTPTGGGPRRRHPLRQVGRPLPSSPDHHHHRRVVIKHALAARRTR